MRLDQLLIFAKFQGFLVNVYVQKETEGAYYSIHFAIRTTSIILTK